MSAQGRAVLAARRRARGIAAVAVPLAVVAVLACVRCGARSRGDGPVAGIGAGACGGASDETAGRGSGGAGETGGSPGREAAPDSGGPGASGVAEGSGGDRAAAGVGAGQAEVDERARAALASYRDTGEAVLAHAGYLDLLGSAWCCVVEGPGWVEVRLVGLDPATGEVGERTLRLDAEAWEDELEAAGVEGG